ncbi:hypothetical protein ES705_43202 [subsurface metagenome]
MPVPANQFLYLVIQALLLFFQLYKPGLKVIDYLFFTAAELFREFNVNPAELVQDFVYL